jgi:hypothetical protein
MRNPATRNPARVPAINPYPISFNILFLQVFFIITSSP